MQPTLGRDEVTIGGETYSLLEERGRRAWTTEEVATQPGDALARPFILAHHGGFGASFRHLGVDGQPSDPAHHDYSENMNAAMESILAPSPRVTYFDLSSQAPRPKMFRIGGYATSRIGGGSAGVPSGAIGGGGLALTPQRIIQFGSFLYVLSGSHTITVDPDRDVPEAVEGHAHGTSARARSGDTFNERLVVALGDTIDAQVVTSPYTASSGASTWTTAPGVTMSVFKRGTAGRLFAYRHDSDAGRVFNLLPGRDPAVAANYFPSAGEVITDASDPVRSLTEFASALVAGTAKTARTIDPDRGFQSVSLLPESRLSPSEYDGRSELAVGPQFFHATTRGVFLLSLNTPPAPVGPEEMELNSSPYVGGQPGHPDFLGDWAAWPYYYPETGDSVIFLMKRRPSSEPGTGWYIWQDFLHLPGRECRAVYFWGGSQTRGPRLFFGAGSESNPLQMGWCDMGATMPDIFNAARPATSATLYYPMDDFGNPGVTLEVERVEIPIVEGADAENYAVWSVQPLGGSYVDLVTSQSGANAERITGNGFQRVFAPDGVIPAGKGLKFRVRTTQADDATEFLKMRGSITAYIAVRPDNTTRTTVVFDVKNQSVESAEEIAARLRARSGQKVELTNAPGGDRTIRIERVEVTEVEVRSGDKDDRRLGVRVSWRDVVS